MAPSEPPRSVLADLAGIAAPVGPPTCGECGALIGNVERHTAWHAGGADSESQGAVLDFLAGIDPDELERHMAAQALSMTTGQAALHVLAEMAGAQ